MDAYAVGQQPPGLSDDGSFDGGVCRVFSVVNQSGQIVVIDKTTKLLVEDTHNDDDDGA